MTSIGRILQKEIFQPNEERLITCCLVGKYLKKKKSSFLCIVSSTSAPINISIVQIKQTDKQSFKRKRSWALAELKSLDGHNDSPDTQEFDMLFDKVYRWTASNIKERQSFIHNLWRQAKKHILKEMPTFKNVPITWITEYTMTPENKFENADLMEMDNENDDEDFQAITEKEQEDLMNLMQECKFSIGNAEAFMEALVDELSMLDEKNVHCVLSSEKQVDSLMKNLNEAIEETERLEMLLDSYDEILCHVKETMEKMEKKNSMISIANRNNQLLLEELEKIVTRLNLSHKHQKTLEDADFTNPAGMKDAIEAGNALKDAMNSNIDKALLQMSAVQEQKRRFEKYKEMFARSISRQLNNLFIHYGNYKGKLEGISMPVHSNIHSDLSSYMELMHWLKVMDQKSYRQLKNVYTDSFGKLYETNVRSLIESARDKIGVTQTLTSPVSLLGQDKDAWTLEISDTNRKKYDTILDQVLTQLEPVCLQEQMFCVKFFQLDVLSPSSKNTLTTLDGAEVQVEVLSPRLVEKQINEDVRNMMTNLFSCLKSELDSLIDHIKRQDSFYCMYVLVRLNDHVMSAKSTFLSNTIGSLLIEVKRSLDQFMQNQIESIADYKPPRRAKCGILAYVLNLEEFATHADCLLKSDRRADLEKWYTRLLDKMIEYIAVHSNEHNKTPSQVIKMGMAINIFSVLSSIFLNLSSLLYILLTLEIV
ncbi:hypothetical protein WA026_023201 [Henosepilachna vigintioctopunctata]|uniref:Exocyst complex component Sec3 PIP2-binding N-terminal domain-containing protein n=1 Tax=Henosepilachna vigintioctopunctata TaxID=420089 RepID=A0AAW1UQI9_9CUCU